MSLKAKIEAIIYAAEEPVTLDQVAQLVREPVLVELAAEKEKAEQEAAEAHTLQVSHDSSDEPFFALEVNPLSLGAGTDQAAPSADEPAPEEAAAASLDSVNTAENETESPVEPAPSAAVTAPEATAKKRAPKKKTEAEIAQDKAVRARVREVLAGLIQDYANDDRGMEIRQVAGGFRMSTKPEHHDLVRAFAKSQKPPIKLSLAALETLAVVAYKQPITGPEISEIRGVESGGVLGTLLDRKLITTAGRKQVIGRPMQYKTSKEFLLRFGLNDVNELPSMEEFSAFAAEATIETTPSEEGEQPNEAPSLFEGKSADINNESAAVATPDSDHVATNREATPQTNDTAEPEANEAVVSDVLPAEENAPAER